MGPSYCSLHFASLLCQPLIVSHSSSMRRGDEECQLLFIITNLNKGVKLKKKIIKNTKP